MCGKSEASFHCSSNINGCVTQTHLCSDCVAKSGYDLGQILGVGGIFEGFFPMLGRPSGFVPMIMPMIDMGEADQIPMRSQIGNIGSEAQKNVCNSGCGNRASDAADDEVDEKMRRRRELNMQMRAAINNEEFEKAAKLRDRLKEVES